MNVAVERQLTDEERATLSKLAFYCQRDGIELGVVLQSVVTNLPQWLDLQEARKAQLPITERIWQLKELHRIKARQHTDLVRLSHSLVDANAKYQETVQQIAKMFNDLKDAVTDTIAQQPYHAIDEDALRDAVSTASKVLGEETKS